MKIGISANFPLSGKYFIYELHKDETMPIFNINFQPKMFGKLAFEQHNLIVDVGVYAIFDYLIGGSNGDFYEVGVGTGTNAPSAGDTALQTPLLWKDATSGRYRVVKDVFTGVTFAAAEAVATWKEAGLRNRAGILISRAAIDYIKTSDYVVSVEWKLSWVD